MKKLCTILCFIFTLPVFAAGNAEAGKEKSTSCAACHGADGNSAVDMYPSLAGQHQKYLIKQLQEFRLGSKTGGEEGRYDPVMSGMAAPLSDQDILDLAAFYNEQKPKPGSAPENVIEKGQKLYVGGDVERGLTACAACHGPRGDGMALANFPDISGQHATYIKKQLEDFRAGKRNNDMNGMMQDVAKRLTDEEIELLSKFLVGLY
ncbi:c-type cytochrome [Lacimicrobium alkaliphilum]|uniref:Cytochrome c n=1 Tax=Lacimicrobium alkaliphilum TaxID=1526571 RepID=A0ABQ1RIV1_9ALTE|nr:c-type cytochrome [Lacimicrobium alkaliphilum]GGD71960.1 cytochrome c [Lacimicrobium alkaliphilum]